MQPVISLQMTAVAVGCAPLGLDSAVHLRGCTGGDADEQRLLVHQERSTPKTRIRSVAAATPSSVMVLC